MEQSVLSINKLANFMIQAEYELPLFKRPAAYILQA